jgi:hypothetical protein
MAALVSNPSSRIRTFSHGIASVSDTLSTRQHFESCREHHTSNFKSIDFIFQNSEELFLSNTFAIEYFFKKKTQRLYPQAIHISHVIISTLYFQNTDLII